MYGELKKLFKECENKTGKLIPEKGYVLAYTRNKVIFENYSTIDEVEEYLENEEIVEIHMFNKEKEFRSLLSRKKGYISNIIDFREDENVYSQKIKLENSDEVLTLLNHINYDDSGMLSIDNYRMYI